MKVFLLFALATFCLFVPMHAAPADAKADPLEVMADTYYVPTATNKVEWKCPAAILGPNFTNDVTYVVKNIQTNRCGVFVVSYPVQSPSKAPVIMEWLADTRPVEFRLKTVKAPIHPSAPVSFPGIEVVEHVEVTLGPLAMPDGRRRTYYAYVDIGKIFYTSSTDIMICRISGETLRSRRFGK